MVKRLNSMKVNARTENGLVALLTTKMSAGVAPDVNLKNLFEFFTLGLSDAFLSDYLTDLKLHSTK